MALTTSSNRVVATGDNSTTRFYFNRLLYDAAHLQVYLDAALQSSGYTVGGIVDPWTANHVDFSVAPGTGVQVLLLRVVPLTQLSVYAVAGAFPAKTTEKNLDLLSMGLQQFDETLDRAVTLPVESPLTAATIPDPADPANYGMGLKIKGDGTGLDTFLLSATPFTSPLTTKGDLCVYSTAADRLPVGANETFLEADSAQGTGMKWTSFLAKLFGILTTAGDVLVSTGSTVLRQAGALNSVPLIGGKLTVTMAANAVTIAIKTDAGADPSATTPVWVRFRHATLTDGSSVLRSITAATSTVISSGSTGGTLNATPARIYVGILDSAGTVELYWFNSLSGTQLFAPNEQDSITTTAEGGAGAADSAHTLYSTTARSGVAHRLVGYFEATEATAGTWATAASKIQLLGPGEKRTGERVQVQRSLSSAVATGTTALPDDDTIPQITEGDEYLSKAITPTSAINLLEVESLLNMAHSAAPLFVGIALFQDATLNALAATRTNLGDNAQMGQGSLQHTLQAGTASSTTFRIRAGSSTGATLTLNGIGGARKYGGVMASVLIIEEIFA